MHVPVVILRNVGPNEFSLEMPRLTQAVDERFQTGVDLMLRGSHPEAQEILRLLLEDFHEHIDAYHHLALSLESEGRMKTALYIRIEALHLAMKFFPDDFSYESHHLPWKFSNNQPFLRLLQGLALALHNDGQQPGAIAILERMLDVDPNDHLASRAILVSCYFERSMTEDVLKLCQRYPNDLMEELLFGKVLALFQSGEITQAGKALKTAIEHHPLIAAELVKEKHTKPRGMNEDRVRAGGKEEAFLYWKHHGKHWQETLGALEWLAEMLEAER